MKGKGRIVCRVMAMFLGGLLFLTACAGKGEEPPSPSGGEEEPLTFLNANGGKGIEVTVQRSDFYDVAAARSDRAVFLGMQFYQGEPVQLWAARFRQGAGGEKLVSVFLYRQDGTEEVFLESVDDGYGRKIFFLDSRGCLYMRNRNTGDDGDTVLKLDREGNVLYKVRLGYRMESVCELADGRVAALVHETGKGGYALVLLGEEGKTEVVPIVQKDIYDTYYLGVSGEGPLLAEGDQVYRVNLGDGTLELLFSFRQTSYMLVSGAAYGSEEIKAFRIREDGSLSVLRSDGEDRGRCEELSLAEPDQRKTVVLRTRYIENQTWFREQLLLFNSTNEKYRVVVEACEEGEDEEAFIANTGMEIATGGGPDILMGSTMLQSPYSVIEKGGLVNLAPLLARSGMKEEDYLPITFDTWRTGEGIYSILCQFSAQERMFSAQVLGDMEHPDIESVADAMLAYPDPAVYYCHSDYSASGVLRELLQGSETLWGAVDWEKSSCDFGGELFGKLLQVAKRYGYDQRNHYPEMTFVRNIWDIGNIYYFPVREEVKKEGYLPWSEYNIARAGMRPDDGFLNEKGYLPVGVLSDDGCHPTDEGRFTLLSVNANAANKEGAWEFLAYLLSEETQSRVSAGFYTPVKKSAMEAALEREMENGPKGDHPAYGYVFEGKLTRERADLIMAFLESVRALPCRTEALIDIVLEESQSYFDGTKDIPQVVDIIENRVNLYLQERKK